MHSAGFGDGGKRGGARKDGLIQVPIKDNCTITEPDGEELHAGREGDRSDLSKKEGSEITHNGVKERSEGRTG